MRASGEMRACFQRDRLILGRDDVLLEQHAIDVGRVDRHVRGTAGGRFEAAELNPQTIFAGAGHIQMLHRSGMSGERAARPDIEADLVEQPLRFELVEVADGVEVGRPPVDLELFGLLVGKGFGQHGFGGGEILFYVSRRQREHRADPLEAVPVGILGQAGGIVHVVMNAQQIENRVGVFLARQLMKRDSFALGQPRTLALFEPSVEPFSNPGRFFSRRLRFVVGGHLAGADAIHHVAPVTCRAAAGKVARERVDAQFSLLLFLAVAAQAIRLQERQHGLIERMPPSAGATDAAAGRTFPAAGGRQLFAWGKSGRGATIATARMPILVRGRIKAGLLRSPQGWLLLSGRNSDYLS